MIRRQLDHFLKTLTRAFVVEVVERFVSLARTSRAARVAPEPHTVTNETMMMKMRVMVISWQWNRQNFTSTGANLVVR